MKSKSRLLLPSVLVLLACMGLLSCGHTDSETPKSFVRLFVADTTSTRDVVASAILKGHGVPNLESRKLVLSNEQGLTTAPIDFGWVTSQGVIAAYSKKHSTVILLEPHFNADSVSWGCVVFPENAKPTECGRWGR